MEFPKAFQSDSFTAKAAKLIFPILIECAKKRTTIEYGQIADLMEREHEIRAIPMTYRFPLTAIGEALTEYGKRTGKDVPPIVALVVNKETHAPGAGFGPFLRGASLEEKRQWKSLSKDDKRRVIADVHRRIFDFQGWDEVRLEG